MKKILFSSIFAALSLSLAAGRQSNNEVKTHCDKLENKAEERPLIENINVIAPDSQAEDLDGETQHFVDEIIVVRQPVLVKYVVEKTCKKPIIELDPAYCRVVQGYSLLIKFYINNVLITKCDLDGGCLIAINDTNKNIAKLVSLKHDTSTRCATLNLREEKILPSNSGVLKFDMNAEEKPRMRNLHVEKVSTDEQGCAIYEVSYYLSMDLKTCLDIESDNDEINFSLNNYYSNYDILGTAQNPMKHRFIVKKP